MTPYRLLFLYLRSISVDNFNSALPVVMIPGSNFSISIFDVHAKAVASQYKITRFCNGLRFRYKLLIFVKSWIKKFELGLLGSTKSFSISNLIV
jgi:hypothetical protein